MLMLLALEWIIAVITLLSLVCINSFS